MSHREAVLKSVRLEELRPTQITVGYREVAEKRRQWREHVDRHGPAFLARHMIPVLLGRKNRHYVIDHHHLARALQEESVAEIAVDVVLDLSSLGTEEFWVYVDNRGWCHPYDDDGKRRGIEDIPLSLSDLADDPYRSLAGELRRAGGFAKETTPFSEFTWADFLRRRIKRSKVEKTFAAALTEALSLSKSREAGHLPGWCGPVTSE